MEFLVTMFLAHGAILVPKGVGPHKIRNIGSPDKPNSPIDILKSISFLNLGRIPLNCRVKLNIVLRFNQVF